MIIQRYMPVAIDLDDDQWEPVGYHGTQNEDPRIRLMGPPVSVNGMLLHTMALEVVDRDGIQEPAAKALREDYDLLQKLYSGCYNTLTVRNRTYVVFLHPYST